jgi:hypothetical protein
VWVEREVDECDSEYYSSEGSKGSARNVDDFFESSDRENIPPQGDKTEPKRHSMGGLKRRTSDNTET